MAPWSVCPDSVETGASTADVQRLSGPPDFVDDGHLDDLLGGCDAVSIDISTLRVELDDAERVVAVRIQVG